MTMKPLNWPVFRQPNRQGRNMGPATIRGWGGMAPGSQRLTVFGR